MILRRIGRTYHHVAGIGILDKEVLEELGATLQHGIYPAQVFLVAREEILLPQMRAEPCVACRPDAYRTVVDSTGGTPQVGIVVEHPAACAIHLGRRTCACYRHIFHHVDKGLVTLGEVCHLSRPVVHFHIDVGGILRVPCRILTGVGIPQALQVGRLSARLRRADEQIAAKLEIVGYKHRVVGILVEILDSLLGILVVALGVLAQVEAHTAELFTILLHMSVVRLFIIRAFVEPSIQM